MGADSIAPQLLVLDDDDDYDDDEKPPIGKRRKTMVKTDFKLHFYQCDQMA